MSKLQKANKKIEEAVVSGYQKVEESVVSGYQKLQDGVVSGYKKVEDKMIDALFAEEGESTEEARARLAKGAEHSGKEHE